MQESCHVHFCSGHELCVVAYEPSWRGQAWSWEDHSLWFCIRYVRGGHVCQNAAWRMPLESPPSRCRAKPCHYCWGMDYCIVNVVALEEGTSTQYQIIQGGCKSNDFVGEQPMSYWMQDISWWVFNEIALTRFVSWTSMLQGVPMMHVHSKEALAHICTHLLTKMSSGPLHLGLSACMHACMLPPLCHFHEYAGTHVAIAMLSQLHNKGSQERASSKGCQ